MLEMMRVIVIMEYRLSRMLYVVNRIAMNATPMATPMREKRVENYQ